MAGPAYHIAQYNVARMRAPLDDPIMEGFRSRLDELNHLGDRSPGFVWRYHTDDGTSTSIRLYPDDPLVIINMTVWESIDSLHAFTYRSDHGPMYAARHTWFEPMTGADGVALKTEARWPAGGARQREHGSISRGHTLVLWWVTAGYTPDPSEGKARLELLRRRGPSPNAFTMKQQFPQPDSVPQAGGSAARP
jgi:Domain of unknown function (DUF3291)